jgi:hypothetical protein
MKGRENNMCNYNLEKIDYTDFSRIVEIVGHAHNSMDGKAFYEFCFSKWHSYGSYKNVDCYFYEKFTKFQNNPIGYLTSLSPNAYKPTIKGLHRWHQKNYEEIEQIIEQMEVVENE